MAGDAEGPGRRRASAWRWAIWGAAAALILVPLVAMQVTDEVNWGLEDFLAAITLVGGVGLAFELAARKTPSRAYRAAVGVALAAAFILVWGNLAVGMLGSEGNRANLLFFGVPVIGAIGAILARFEPRGMTCAMVATALAQLLSAMIALVAGHGLAGPLTAFFAALWLASAWLFRKAAAERVSEEAGPSG